MSLSPHVGSIPWRASPPAEEATSDAPVIVLVVDDYANCRTATRFLLQSAGHEVIEAATGLEAMMRPPAGPIANSPAHSR